MKKNINSFDLSQIKKLVYCPRCQGRTMITESYVIIMLFLYPLYMSDTNIFNFFQEKTLIFSLLTLLTGILLAVAVLRGSAIYKRILNRVDIFLLITALLLAVKAIYRVTKGDMSFEKEGFLLCLILVYFVLRGVKTEYQYYVRLFLYASVFLLIGLLGYLLTGEDMWLGIEIMFHQSGAVPSFLLLACGCSALMYCLYEENGWDTFYLILSGIGFAVLFLYRDMLAICLTGIFLLMIPVIFSPTVRLVKKNLILCFLFLFIGSNIPLLKIMDWVRIEHEYDLRYSVYIDLFLAVIGSVICQYWTKIPQNVDPGRVVMKKFRNWYIQALALVGSILLFCMMLGERLGSLPDKWGIAGLKLFGNALRQSMTVSDSFIYYLLAEYGLIGCIIWLLLGILVIKRLIRQWKKTDQFVGLLCMIGGLFWIQTYIYQLQPSTTPIYIIFLTFALHAERVGGDRTQRARYRIQFKEEGSV